MTFFGDMTWSCHICGKERPDACISVQKNKALVGSAVVDNNVRYCNDSLVCAKRAMSKVFTGEQIKDSP